MTARSLAFLIVLNVALLAALFVLPSGQREAEAQFGGGRSYTLIAGDVTGRGNQAAVYVVDLNNGVVIPVFFNGSNNEFELFEGSVVSDDASRMGQAQR